MYTPFLNSLFTTYRRLRNRILLPTMVRRSDYYQGPVWDSFRVRLDALLSDGDLDVDIVQLVSVLGFGFGYVYGGYGYGYRGGRMGGRFRFSSRLWGGWHRGPRPMGFTEITSCA